jgi:hypothetical protein
MNDEYTGNLLEDYKPYLSKGFHLVVMPISRVEVEWFPRIYPAGITFYPTQFVYLDKLGIIPNDPHTKSPAELASFASRIDQEILDKHPLIVFPGTFRWHEFRRDNYRGHLEFIRTLSDYVDRICLNYIRYLQCPLDNVHSLPGRAGTVNSNPMMSGALLYNHNLGEGRIIGGDAFTHAITRGLGLPIESVDHALFPKNGEVGFIVNHALALYTTLLETGSPTLRFVQALSLLEFLAYPDEYKKFQDVKKVIAQYVAQDRREYEKLLHRFYELTGKKDEITKRFIGYRTRIVHLGERLEEIIPNEEQRRELFSELQGYIKVVIDHMIKHSELTWAQYLSIRENLRPYEI